MVQYYQCVSNGKAIQKIYCSPLQSHQHSQFIVSQISLVNSLGIVCNYTQQNVSYPFHYFLGVFKMTRNQWCTYLATLN